MVPEEDDKRSVSIRLLICVIVSGGEILRNTTATPPMRCDTPGGEKPSTENFASVIGNIALSVAAL